MPHLQHAENIDELLGDSSRLTIDMVVKLVSDNPVLFKKFLDKALEDKGQLTMRAARVVNFTTLNFPKLFAPYAKEVIYKLPEIKNDSLKRELIKTFAENDFELDDETLTCLLETSFRWFTDQNEKIAVQAYALNVLYKISNLFPDLKFELISVIQQHEALMSSGMKVRIRKMLPQLIKETNQML